ncbi:hypothetical protein B7494_g1622 [Chlorociboria aeruginascens]|nr:hypothetical protein B7494_g1622 [Chlorociboria aeruginascens]
MSYSQYEQYSGNPYDNGPGAEAGQASGITQPGPEYELPSNRYPNSGAPAASSSTLSQQDFLERVDLAKGEIRTLSSNISQVATLHQRALSAPDSNSSAQLENLVTQTQLKNTQIRDQIKFLEADALKTKDGSKGVKARQAKQLKGEFEKALRDYQEEELNYRQQYRAQIARQYLIVNPDASEAEVEDASNQDWGSEGVFQTALKSNRSGQASSVLGAVRARHNELQHIESTLTELAAIFADMAQIVEVQDAVIGTTENNAIQTADEVDKANNQIEKANEHIRRRNRLKWWCLLVVILIILAIALGVGLGVGLAVNSSKKATGN